ncbi:Fc.00g105020.m01.CDS01 [Cosmosporella sp. VM-42]
MFLKHLLLGVSLPLALAQDLVFNCASFWPSLSPGDSFTVNADCRMYPGWPKTIGQTTVSVIYTNDWQGNLGIIDNLLNEAIVQSVAFYGNLVPPPDLVIVLGAIVNEDAALDAWMPTFPEGPCQIRSFEHWATEEAIAMSPVAMQAVAHEIYHCVQHKMLGNSDTNSPSLWVIESSAEYFSNLVFSKANGEWDEGIEYDPEVPIFEQLYKPNLWFQSLERSRGMVYLHEFVMSTIFANSPDEERARLASMAGFADDFFLFARDFSFNRIMDTGGGIVPIQHPPERRNVIWSVNEDETEGTTILETTTFTISQFTTEFDPGQNIKLYSSAKGNQRIAYRLQSDTYWSEVPSGGSSGGSQGVITIPCASSPVKVRFLVTSTEAKAADKVEVSFIQQYKDENCCKKGRKRAASACPTSSRPVSTTAEPEPTGTGTGSCAGSSIAMDPCLTKNAWSLDIPSTQALLKRKLSELPEITIRDVRVSGGGGLKFDGKEVSFTYKGLATNFDITAADLDFSGGVTIDGQSSGFFFITTDGGGSGTACIHFKSGSGTAKAYIPFIGEVDFDLTPGGGYIADMTIDYKCSGNSLTIVSSGVDNPLGGGGPAWGPFAYNAV